MSRHHHRPDRPAQPQPGTATRARWANKRDHVLRRVDKDPTLTATARDVAHALADFSDRSAKACWPAQTTLAERLGVVPKTVQRAIAELEAAGYLSVRRHRPRYHRERAGFARKTNCYCLRMPKGPVDDYRDGQRRRYRSAEWKARASAWVAAHRPAQPGSGLGDSRDPKSPSGGAHPGARTPDCGQLPADQLNESAVTPPPDPPATHTSPSQTDSGCPGGGVPGQGGVAQSTAGVGEPDEAGSFERNEELAHRTIAACKALLSSGRSGTR